jgi:hypothetical protein
MILANVNQKQYESTYFLHLVIVKIAAASLVQ